METFVRAVITGFGFSLGKTLFEKVKDRFMPDQAKVETATDADYDDELEDGAEARPE